MSHVKRWIVRAGEGSTVADILARMREPSDAVAEGRVFVGRIRVDRADRGVSAGDEVRVGAAAGDTPSAADDDARVARAEILFERDGILACVKPAGIPTVPDHAGASHALVASVARAIGRRPDELRVTSRLDREVSGVVLFALDAAAEDRLRVARSAGRYRRRYVAIAAAPSRDPSGGRTFRGQNVQGPERSRDRPSAGESGEWREAIGAGRDARHRAVAGGANAKDALTRWRVVAEARAGGFAALLALEPVTGRTHQIRVHASHAGMPLLGDRDYGGASRLSLAGGRVVSLDRIALHCARVAVADARPLVAEAPIPSELAAAWSALGGAPEAWENAVSCELGDASSSSSSSSSR